MKKKKVIEDLGGEIHEFAREFDRAIKVHLRRPSGGPFEYSDRFLPKLIGLRMRMVLAGAEAVEHFYKQIHLLDEVYADVLQLDWLEMRVNELKREKKKKAS